MSSIDIRWHQRFANFNRAFAKLTEAVSLIDLTLNEDELDESLSELEKEGVIQRFEYTHELAWNVMKDYLEYQGNSLIGGSRDATREAFKINLITDGETWMDMIKSRNQTTHTYNEETANQIFLEIVNVYYERFSAFQAVMENLRSRSHQDDFFNEV